MFNVSSFKILGGVVVVTLIGAGGYYISKSRSLVSLRQNIDKSIAEGDYLAALASYNVLKNAAPRDVGLQEKIAVASRFLVAEENFKNAKQAAERDDWETVRALLQVSDALTSPAFKYYEEAKQLYVTAEALAAGAVHKTAVTISSLEEKAASSELRRQALEKNKTTLEGVLSATEVRAADAQKKLSETETAAKETASQLVAEQSHTKALLEQVAKESQQKFFNELKVYRDMAAKGNTQLQNAMTEINGSRDVTALVYVSQGRILFDEAKGKVVDMRANRTPASYQARVEDLTNALGSFIDAAKQVRNAVVYIDEQSGSDFTGSIAKAKSSLSVASALLSAVSGFIAANQ